MTEVALTLLPGYIVLLAFLLFTITVYMLLNRAKEFTEEEVTVTPTLVSPASKIVKLIFVKVIVSAEAALMILALLLTALTTGFTVAYTYSYTSIDARVTTYSILLISNHHINVEKVLKASDMLSNSSYVRVIQVFHEILVESNGSKTYFLPLIIDCSNYVSEELNNTIAKLCRLIIESDKDVALVDVSNDINVERLTINNVELLVARENLSKYLLIPLLPNLFLIHTIGTIGGTALSASPSTVVVLPYSEELYKAVCENNCNARELVLVTSPLLDDKDAIVDFLLKFFDIVVLRKDSKVYMYSRSLVPSIKTVLGLFTSLLLSITFSLTISGGIAERIAQISEKLSLVGITQDTITAATSIALALVFVVFVSPLIVLSIFNKAIAISILSYILSAVTVNTLVTQKVSRRLKIGKYKALPRYTITINSVTPVEPELFKNVVQRLFVADDLFMLSEVEVLRGSRGYTEFRVELIHKKSFATIADVEVYEEKNKDIWSYTLSVDIWSIEELSKHEQSKIALLALSKVHGALMQCITRF